MPFSHGNYQFSVLMAKTKTIKKKKKTKHNLFEQVNNFQLTSTQTVGPSQL